MPTEQLVLDLARRPALGREDFFVSPANQRALALLDAWHIWPVPRLALTGGRGLGKSHLARVWAGESGATIVSYDALIAFESRGFDPLQPLVVEDADRLPSLGPAKTLAAEKALFHIHNALAESGTTLVVTGRDAPARWTIGLPDLASRLAAMPLASIEPPDSALLDVLLVKFFADKQVHVTPDVIAYLGQRIDRDGASAAAIVDALDNAALQARRAITRPFAAEVLKGLGQTHEPS
jgi:chromosomal replication initiation ATPase DnaA